MKEMNKFLTEAMDECWHGETYPTGDSIHVPIKIWCGYCKALLAEEPYDKYLQNNFSTPEGFFKLWNFAIEQDWWLTDFVSAHGFNGAVDALIKAEYINPERFAKAVYEYLNDGGSPSKP